MNSNINNNIEEVPFGETKESFLKCRIGNLKRIQDLYSTSILKYSNSFLGPIETDLILLERKMAEVVKQMEAIQ